MMIQYATAGQATESISAQGQCDLVYSLPWAPQSKYFTNFQFLAS